MIPFYKSKYHRRLEKEKTRENEIQNIQENYQGSREWAVRHNDELDNKRRHMHVQFLAGALFGLGGRYTINSLGRANRFLYKSYIYYPLIASSFWLGHCLYNKLNGHYLNLEHLSEDGSNSYAHWQVDYKQKYNTDIFEPDPSLYTKSELLQTPFELEKEAFMKNLNSIGVDGRQVYKRQSKDKDDLQYIFGKVRNLENLAFMDDSELLRNINNPLELQLKMDSITPVFKNPVDMNELLKSYHSELEKFKMTIENLPKFRSEKEKLLGMPFFAHRQRQYPVPEPGTWQYDLFQEIYGKPYHFMKDVVETQEKINKFNYNLFLHPSIIDKYDVESDEFDIFVRNLNLENLTEKETMMKYREEYCRNFMPILNTLNDPLYGKQVAHYILNKNRSSDYDSYLFQQYSNQREEELFRMAEEARFLDKNKNLLFHVQYATINKNKIGLKPEELKEILDNPTKQREIRDAFQNSFPSYDPTTHMDNVKNAYKRVSYNETLMENEDKLGPDFEWTPQSIDDLQYEDYYSDEDEMINNFTGHSPMYHDISNPPGAKVHLNWFYYNTMVDLTEYQERFGNPGFISPKAMRLTLFESGVTRNLSGDHYRVYNNPKWEEFNTNINPAIDAYDEEKAEKVRKKSPRYKYFERNENKSSERETREFLEDSTEEELENSKPKNITEELIDQALYEAQYIKKDTENDEYKKLDKRNPYVVYEMFKAIGFEPFENWMDPPAKEMFANLGIHSYVDKVQRLDPFYHLLSEIEQPILMRQFIEKWRRGAEIRIKLPYYPDTKKPAKTFDFNF